VVGEGVQRCVGQYRVGRYGVGCGKCVWQASGQKRARHVRAWKVGGSACGRCARSAYGYARCARRNASGVGGSGSGKAR